MVECKGCRNWYHRECIFKAKKDWALFEEENMKTWCCNLVDFCQHRRDNEFLQKYYDDNYIYEI